MVLSFDLFQRRMFNIGGILLGASAEGSFFFLEPLMTTLGCFQIPGAGGRKGA